MNEAKIWVIHAGTGGEADRLFRERNVIALGFNVPHDLGELEPTREAFRTILAREHPDDKQGAIRVRAGTLYRFVREMHPGDLLLYPARGEQTVTIGRVEGPYSYAPEVHPVFPHQRAVTWLMPIQRGTLSKGARNEMGGLGTLSEVRRHVAEIRALLDGRDGEPTGTTTPTSPEPPPDPFYADLMDALERKGQIILYGPPGTGKTFLGRRFAAWWLRRGQGAGGQELAGIRGEADAHARAEEKLTRIPDGRGAAPLTLLTFHPSYSYEDFIEGYRPVPTTDGTLSLRLEDGVFKRVCREAEKRPEEHFLVLIDEINRANIAKVFGELITLLEKDKRGMRIILPQSKQPFTIPPNVYILGTMNTADKSIKLLDAALRRRFAFEELLPDPTLFEGASVQGMPLDRFLEELNARIARTEGREKQIGHSFLLEQGEPVTEPEEFGRRFRQEILPLLQEYAYDDYAELAEYIGDKLVDKEAQRLNEVIMDDTAALLSALGEEFGTLAPGTEGGTTGAGGEVLDMGNLLTGDTAGEGSDTDGS